MRPVQLSQRHLTATRGFILPGNRMSTIHQQSPQRKAAAVPLRSDRHIRRQNMHGGWRGDDRKSIPWEGAETLGDS